jgi:hypothetical protein
VLFVFVEMSNYDLAEVVAAEVELDFGDWNCCIGIVAAGVGLVGVGLAEELLLCIVVDCGLMVKGFWRVVLLESAALLTSHVVVVVVVAR